MSTNQKPTWAGIFDSFAAVKGDETVFDGPVWVERIADGAKRALARSTGGAVPPVALTTDIALPFIAASAARGDRPLRILDFGGGMATSYLPLRAMLPKTTAIEFVVVETSAVVQKGRELFAADAGVHFRVDLPAPTERFDIVQFCSSLHYVDDWRGMLEAVTRFEPSYLLFVDLTAADNRSFVTAQHYQDRRIPVRFWNVEEFIAEVSRLGYELVLKARYRGYYLGPDAELPTTNFDEPDRLTYTSQLVFRRARVAHDSKEV